MFEDNLNQNIARPELLQIAESVAREKSIDQNIVIQAMEQAIQSAAKRKYGQELEIRAGINKKSGELKNNLIRYEGNKKIIEEARTLFKVLDKNSLCSLVEMKPITGRKHQLRKQLFALGHPVFGDDKYKLTNLSKSINKNLMLHSYEIKFMINMKKYTYKALIPDYFKKLLKVKRLSFSNF